MDKLRFLSVCVVFVVGTPSPAQQSINANASTAPPASIKSNQGASIDAVDYASIDADAEKDLPASIDAEHTSDGRSGNDMATTEQGALPTPAPSSVSGQSSRTLPLPAGDQLLRKDKSATPWYRSGIMSLVIVLAIIGGAAVLLRRFVPQVAGSGGGVIDMLARTHISPRQSMALVRVGRRVLLVGITPERMTVLCETDDAEEVALLSGKARRTVSDDEGFESMLAQSSVPFDDDEDDPTAEFVRGPSNGLMAAQGRLKGLLAKLHTVRS